MMRGVTTTPASGSPYARYRRYGIDAPYVPALLALAGLIFLVLAVVLPNSSGALIPAVVFLGSAAGYLHATLRGKFVAWDHLLDGMHLAAGERLADLGCGRGAVLLAAARRLPAGTAHGVDLWRSQDQSGNAEAVTRENARAEGLSERVELHTADLTALPFADHSLDAITSSLAIHNIRTEAGRCTALDEAMRVLRPGGRLCIADIRHTRAYGEHLRQVGAGEVAVRNLGVRCWFGGPWTATSVVTATKAELPAGP
jgi:arsenite methyltransferase